jgi:hypothetical protein
LTNMKLVNLLYDNQEQRDSDILRCFTRVEVPSGRRGDISVIFVIKSYPETCYRSSHTRTRTARSVRRQVHKAKHDSVTTMHITTKGH